VRRHAVVYSCVTLGGLEARPFFIHLFVEGKTVTSHGCFRPCPALSTIVALTIAAWNASAAGQCQPYWDTGFGFPPGNGMDSSVASLELFDDGSGTGPAVFAGGSFLSAGGVPVNGLAKFTGSGWQTVGEGVTATQFPAVDELKVFDDGSAGGPWLYVGGYFTQANGIPANGVAKWNGTQWLPLGGGVTGGTPPGINTMVMRNEGGVNMLYAGGRFTTAGGAPANNIARWDGKSWTALGDGVNQAVTDLAFFDDGGGEALYAVGLFTTAGGQDAKHVAKWDGNAWSPLTTGLSYFGSNSWGKSLGVFDEGDGPRLYVGGHFTAAGGVAANNIARWDGASWSPVGAGASGTVSVIQSIDLDGDKTPHLMIAGDFWFSGSDIVNFIATWDGAQWSGLPGGGGAYGHIFDVLPVHDPEGPALFIGGYFDNAGNGPSQRIARWVGHGAPSLSEPPASVDIELGEPISMTVAANSPAPLGFQWRKRQKNLQDDGNISGALTDTLLINAAAYADAGDYDVIVANECGMRIAGPASVIVHPPCPADIGDDDVVDLNDLLGVIGAWNCRGDCTADVTGNGVVDVDDLLAVINGWGACP
jgi:hypothetical protein